MELMPGAEARAALQAAAARVAPDMKTQEVANSLSSFLAFAATRGVALPACYPSLWRAACAFDVDSFAVVELRSLFQSYLAHAELVSKDVLNAEPVSGNVRNEVTFPPWIMHEARGAWMRGARDDVTVSN